MLGQPCVLMNPWPGACVVRDGDAVILTTANREVRLDTTAGDTYLIESEETPVRRYQATLLHDVANDRPGLPGRDRN